MNPVKFFKQLVANTVFNSGASAFLQAIAGHRPENHPVTIKKNLQHIQKEAQEGIDILDIAIKEVRNLTQEETKKVRDAYADVRVLLDGAKQMATFPWEVDYKAVLESLITRFDPTMVDAVKTQQKYEAINVVTRIHLDSDTGMYVNIVKGYLDAEPSQELKEEYPVGKWLKSYKYQEPQLIDAGVVAFPVTAT